MNLLRLPLLLLLATAMPHLAAETAGANAPAATTARADLEQATVTGTVTALNPQRHSFTLKATGANDEFEYRAYFRDGKQQEVLTIISGLTIGETITVTYTEVEGRRALTIVVPEKAANTDK
jgi:hypothetical protein